MLGSSANLAMMCHCRRISIVVGVAALALACVATPAAAQEPRARPASGGYTWALGLGAGLVQPDGAGDAYLSATLRRRLRSDVSRRPDPDDGRARWNEASAPSVRGYLEAEVGYWKRSGATASDRDLLLGLNLVGVMPTRGADLFVGVGFGVHFAETGVTTRGVHTTEDETRFGGNLHFGVDVHVSGRATLFGAGRIDLLEGEANRQQSKVWGGLRLGF